MLLQLRDFIRKNQIVSIQQLSREFHIDEQALQPMLEIWMRKGAIRPSQTKSACKSSCYGCGPKKRMFYEYITTF